MDVVIVVLDVVLIAAVGALAYWQHRTARAIAELGDRLGPAPPYSAAPGGPAAHPAQVPTRPPGP